MKLRELLDGLDIADAAADMDARIGGVSYDSRRVKPGDVFVAVRGYNSDGHGHVAQAAAAGAVCVVAQRGAAVPDGMPYVVVKNTRAALAVMSANLFGRPAEKLKIVGVTGTNGKTTVTSLIKEILERSTGARVGLVGTIRNMIGDVELQTDCTTPESYELQELFAKMTEAGCEYAVMEVSSHALALDRVYGISFEAAVFTNLTPDHLDFHGTMEEYGRAKLKLFGMCRRGAVNLDDAFAGDIMGAARPENGFVTFSAQCDDADLVAKRVKLFADRTEFCALTIGVLQKVELAIPGLFSVYNALAAISAAAMLGVSVRESAAALRECSGIMGRAEVAPTGRDFTVLIDYAHTPDALEKIIAAARQGARGRVVTLFGCGGDRDGSKRALMGAIASKTSDFVVITTDNPRTEEPGAIIRDILSGVDADGAPYVVIENRREAIKWAIRNSKAGDVLILAGKGHETYQILGTEKIHFDEREVVAEALAAADD